MDCAEDKQILILCQKLEDYIEEELTLKIVTEQEKRLSSERDK